MVQKLTFIPTEIEDVLEVRGPVFSDDRGFFCEIHNQRTWAEAGFEQRFVQDNMSLSRRGTLRGMHYQLEPRAMGKYIRVVRGSIFDVAVDLRRGADTFGRWVGRTLSGENHVGMWVPAGFAHGFVALEDETLVYYKCTDTYHPASERSVAYNDPEIGIEWPLTPTVITAKDADAPRLNDAEYNFGLGL
jgi:dTDP-4-dehydrorhamnose 3,5-epimerase